MNANTGLFDQIKSVFSPHKPYKVSEMIAHLDEPFRTPEQDVLFREMQEYVNLPLVTDTDEELERSWYFLRGQKLVRQENWETLSDEIKKADAIHANTIGGIPIAELLTRGARMDVVRPIEMSLKLNQQLPTTAGLADYHGVLNDHLGDYGVALIVAYAHIDAGWAWHDYAPTENAETHLNTFRRHFRLANQILAGYDPLAEGSAALAAAQCAALAGRSDAQSVVVNCYQDLIDLDPTSPQHLRQFGQHLLPSWFGSYQKLEDSARGQIEYTSDIWGSGAYAWMYFDALANDAGAFEHLDVDLFLGGILDIFERQTDQHTANLWSAYLSLTMAEPALGHETAIAKRKRLRLKETADWVIDAHLTEIHPVVWSDAIPRVFVEADSTDVETANIRGSEIATRVLYDRILQMRG